MAVATLETIRDRIIALITAMAPTSLAGDRFLVSRDESEADFRKMCESSPTGALRRFQVRSAGKRGRPEVSNGDVAQHPAVFTITIAYPNTHRYGPNEARDRDDVIDQDLTKLDTTVGLFARANFSGTNDCTPLGFDDDPPVNVEGAISYLVITARYNYTLSVTG